ncbi:MAG: hypothetical protein AAF192_15420 [Pseudomonadota bacterium]
MSKRFAALAAAALTGWVGAGIGAGTASAGTVGHVTPDYFAGTGNANGGFTIGTGGGVEIGLRAKLRFDDTNTPQNVFNQVGTSNVYEFEPRAADPGFSFFPSDGRTPIWNFDWSINTDFDEDDGLGGDLAEFTYVLSLGDGKGGALTFDPINDARIPDDPLTPGVDESVVQWDHALGGNGSGPDCNAAGACVSFSNADLDEAGYLNEIDSTNVAQNSWNYRFFVDAIDPAFDPTAPGSYDISLTAFKDGSQVASSSIQVNVVPAPLGLLLLPTAFVAAAALRRRRRAASV